VTESTRLLTLQMRKPRDCTVVLAHALLPIHKLPLPLLQPVNGFGLSISLIFFLNADDVANLGASIFDFLHHVIFPLSAGSNPIVYTLHTTKRTSYTSEKLRQALEGIGHLRDISASSRFAPS